MTATVLLVEDQMLLGFALRRRLESEGFSVVGPAASVAAATALLDGREVDFAVLDINLGFGTDSLAIADTLAGLGVPFVFLSGYGSGRQLPDRFSAVTRFTKPANEAVAAFARGVVRPAS